MQASSVPRGFFFGSLSSKQSPKSPRLSSYSKQDRSPASSLSPPPAVEPRARSASTVDQQQQPQHTRKRSGTFSSTVDHLTSFWESKNEKEKKEKHKEQDKEKISEVPLPPPITQPNKKPSKSSKSAKPSKPIPISGKEHVKFQEREAKKSHNEERNNLSKEGHCDHRRYSKEANVVISNEVFEAMKGLNEIRTRSNTYTPPTNTPVTTAPATVSKSSDSLEPPKLNGRVKHKAKSEGSLLTALFSRKLERGGPMQKSSSLIEMKPTPPTSTHSKSGSAIQIGKRPQGYFGVTLNEAMEMQKEKYPSLLIPVIMVKLTEAIVRFEGCKAEGIFRVAGSTQHMARMQQQLNSMDFESLSTLSTSSMSSISSDPHVLVGVLKQWLRDLKDPLIPNDIYRECVQCETTQDCLKVIAKMPDVNKATFGHLVGFLREISKPEHVPFTKMDVHNLCLVSAPVLFRCPSTDMAELVVNMQKEKIFLGLVLESSAFM